MGSEQDARTGDSRMCSLNDFQKTRMLNQVHEVRRIWGTLGYRKAAIQKRTYKVRERNSCWGERKTRGMAVLRLCTRMCLTFSLVMRLAQSTES